MFCLILRMKGEESDFLGLDR